MVPDSKLAREATDPVRDAESPLLFNHSTRVYYFGSLAGKRRGVKFDPELLYVAAMFHDMGLTPRCSNKSARFEVDGANSARGFLRLHNISRQEIDTVWTAIALHTTPGIPQYMHPVVALLTNGVEMDVLGIAYSEFSYQIVHEHPAAEMRIEDTGLGIPRSERIVMVQVTTRPRSRFEKQTFYELPCQELLRRCEIEASDVVVLITQNADEDWSFGYGRAQFITGEL